MYPFYAFFENFRSDFQSLAGWVAFSAFAAFVVGMAAQARNSILASRREPGSQLAQNQIAVGISDFHSWFRAFFLVVVLCELITAILWCSSSYAEWARRQFATYPSTAQLSIASALLIVAHVRLARRYFREASTLLNLDYAWHPFLVFSKRWLRPQPDRPKYKGSSESGPVKRTADAC
jgi:hypothetical protein